MGTRLRSFVTVVATAAAVFCIHADVIRPVQWLSREIQDGSCPDAGAPETLLQVAITSIGEQPQGKPKVTFLRLDEAAGKVFMQWPLAELDFAVLTKNLALFEPRTVGIVEGLAWGRSDPTSERVLVRQLKNLSLVLGCILDANAIDPLSDEEHADLAAMPNVSGDISKLPVFTGIGDLAIPEVRRCARIGFTQIDFGEAIRIRGQDIHLPLLARCEDAVFGSFVLHLILDLHGVACDETEVTLGEEIRIGGSLRIPIDESGMLVFQPHLVRDRIVIKEAEISLPTPSGMEMNTGNQGFSSGADALGNSVVLIGNDHEKARRYMIGDDDRISLAEMQALAIAAIEDGTFREAKEVQESLPGDSARPDTLFAILRPGDLREFLALNHESVMIFLPFAFIALIATGIRDADSALAFCSILAFFGTAAAVLAQWPLLPTASARMILSTAIVAGAAACLTLQITATSSQQRTLP